MFKSAVVSVLLACLLSYNRAYAQTTDARPRLRVQVPAENDLDAKLFERLRGQTSDLAVELTRFGRRDRSAEFGAEASLARCGKDETDVIVWASPQSASVWRVGITTCRDGTSLIRKIEMERPALGGSEATSSGALEAAALVLRGALGVLAQGGVLGVVAPPTVETVAPVSTPSPSVAPPAAPSNRLPTPPVHASVSTDSRVPPTSSSIESLNLLGWGHSWDGGTALGRPALYAAIALGGRYFQAGLAGSLGIGTGIDDQYTELTLTKHTLVIQGRQRLMQTPRWSVTVGIDLGSVFYYRTTRVLESTAVARPAGLVAAPLLSPWASLSRQIGPLWIALSAGLDALPWVPRFTYSISGQARTAFKPWPVAPRLLLSLATGRP